MMGRNTFAFRFTFLFALSRYSCKCESLDRCNSKVRMVTLETSELTERKMEIGISNNGHNFQTKISTIKKVLLDSTNATV